MLPHVSRFVLSLVLVSFGMQLFQTTSFSAKPLQLFAPLQLIPLLQLYAPPLPLPRWTQTQEEPL